MYLVIQNTRQKDRLQTSVHPELFCEEGIEAIILYSAFACDKYTGILEPENEHPVLDLCQPSFAGRHPQASVPVKRNTLHRLIR